VFGCETKTKGQESERLLSGCHRVVISEAKGHGYLCEGWKHDVITLTDDAIHRPFVGIPEVEIRVYNNAKDHIGIACIDKVEGVDGLRNRHTVNNDIEIAVVGSYQPET